VCVCVSACSVKQYTRLYCYCVCYNIYRVFYFSWWLAIWFLSSLWTANLIFIKLSFSFRLFIVVFGAHFYRGADKSLVRPGRKQARKHVRDARDFNNIETRAVIKFFFLQGKTPKEIHDILTETLACFLPSRAKDLSAPLYKTANYEVLMFSSFCFFYCRAKDLSAPLYKTAK